MNHGIKKPRHTHYFSCLMHPPEHLLLTHISRWAWELFTLQRPGCAKDQKLMCPRKKQNHEKLDSDCSLDLEYGSVFMTRSLYHFSL